MFGDIIGSLSATKKCCFIYLSELRYDFLVQEFENTVSN